MFQSPVFSILSTAEAEKILNVFGSFDFDYDKLNSRVEVEIL